VAGNLNLYWGLESLQTDGVVGSENQSVEVFRRNPLGSWEFIAYEAGGEVMFDRIGLRVAVAASYEDVDLEPPGPNEMH
jgi:hypothetical protein